MLTVNNYSGSNYNMAFSSKFSNLKRILQKNGLYEKGMTVEEMEKVIGKYGLNIKNSNRNIRKPNKDFNNYKEQDLPKEFRLGKQF